MAERGDRSKTAEQYYRTSGLRLKDNQDGTFTDQYGRVLEPYTNEHGKPDLKPVGLDRKGANH